MPNGLGARLEWAAPVAALVLCGVVAHARTSRLAKPHQARVSARLEIVVIEGEGAVNIIQQKTAVAPVVEVRDANNQPVAGAIVRFAVRSGKATFSGSRALSVTTNAAGRAVAAGLTPTGSGALQISAAASFQGQTAALTIVQTNVMTAAQAAGVAGATGAGGGGGSGAGAAAGAAAGGGGGGLSATTIAIIGGAAAGGAVVATQVAGGGSLTRFQGSISGPWRLIASPTCTFDIQEAGTVSVEINTSNSAAITGKGEVNDTHTFVAVAPGCIGQGVPTVNSVANHGCCAPPPPVTGSAGNLGFSGSHPGLNGTTYRYDFSGALNGAEIVGAYTLTVTTPIGGSSATFPVTLR